MAALSMQSGRATHPREARRDRRTHTGALLGHRTRGPRDGRAFGPI